MKPWLLAIKEGWPGFCWLAFWIVVAFALGGLR
jgi:hypothetical protein